MRLSVVSGVVVVATPFAMVAVCFVLASFFVAVVLLVVSSKVVVVVVAIVAVYFFIFCNRYLSLLFCRDAVVSFFVTSVGCLSSL